MEASCEKISNSSQRVKFMSSTASISFSRSSYFRGFHFVTKLQCAVEITTTFGGGHCSGCGGGIVMGGVSLVSCGLNPLSPELNPICYLLALLGAHHFLHVSRIRVKLLTFRRLMSYIYIWSTHS